MPIAVYIALKIAYFGVINTSQTLLWVLGYPQSLLLHFLYFQQGHSLSWFVLAVVIFEVEGGTDKGEDGHRKDTLPIVAALRDRGWEAEVIRYSDPCRDEICDYVSTSADAFLSRINPGTYPNYSEETFMAMCRELLRR